MNLFNCLNGKCKECNENCRFRGGKMEDKTIKVRCINNNGAKDLLHLNKEYIVYGENEKRYEAIDEKGTKDFWGKTRFEKVEDALMVECIDNQDELANLTIGEKYKAIYEDSGQYKVIDNNNDTIWINKSRFKPVEPQKEEAKEYTAMQLLDFPLKTEFKNIESGCYVKIDEIDGIKAVVTFNKEHDYKKWNEEAVAPINEVWKKIKFVRVDPQKAIKEEFNNEPIASYIDYEEEYKKLASKNEELHAKYKNLNESFDFLKKENEELRKTNVSYYDEYKEALKILQEENKKLEFQLSECKEKIKVKENQMEEFYISIKNLIKILAQKL